MNRQINIAVVGASGRMGRQLTSLIAASDKARLVAAITHSASSILGEDVGSASGQANTGLCYSDDLSQAADEADVIIDFSLPVALRENVRVAAQHETPIVVCTTGLTDEHQDALREASKRTAVLYAANTSLGVNLLRELVRLASRALGDKADIEILEAHHTAKRDAPSGTALALGEAAAQGRGQSLEQVAELHRNENPEAYRKGSIGFATLRAGDIVGEHTVYLVNGGERLELSHRVASRQTFAEGALNAAFWLHQQNPGFYSMNHVLGLDG